MKLVPGLYETLINQFIEAGIKEAASQQLSLEVRALDSGDSHIYLAQYLADRIRKAFASIPQAERLESQLELANRILLLLSDNAPQAFDREQSRLLRAELLLALSNEPIQRADTPLSTSCLMTGSARIRLLSRNCARRLPLPIVLTFFAPSSSGAEFGSSKMH